MYVVISRLLDPQDTWATLLRNQFKCPGEHEKYQQMVVSH